MTPTLHRSALWSYRPRPNTVVRRCKISGAKYRGVPQKVLSAPREVRGGPAGDTDVADGVDDANALANPKSAILRSKSLSRDTSNTFSGLRSRWTTFRVTCR